MSLDDEALEQLTQAGPGRRCASATTRPTPPGASSSPASASRCWSTTDSFVEDGRYANALADGLPADGVITGTATVDGRPVCLMANDSTVKAGSWGARTVEKIIRIIERAYDDGVPMIYLVDSAGARITDQVDLFPGRRGAGQHLLQPGPRVRQRSRRSARCSARRPPVAPTSRRSATWSRWSTATRRCTSARDRMVEMVTGEKTTLEAMGGAQVHCAESGVGHFLCKDEAEALDVVRRYLSYLPSNWHQARRRRPSRAAPPSADLAALVPAERAAGLRHAPVRQGPARRRTASSRSRRCGPAS